jgi:hypothetical protein
MGDLEDSLKKVTGVFTKPVAAAVAVGSAAQKAGRAVGEALGVSSPSPGLPGRLPLGEVPKTMPKPVPMMKVDDRIKKIP